MTTHGESPASWSPVCLRCGRALRNPVSQERGYGPLCWRKVQATQARAEREREEAMTGLPINEAGDIVIWRDPDGTVRTNVPWSVVVHSPDGYNFGYGGSGPSDLALNILNMVVPPDSDGRESHRGWQNKGRYSATAWEFHHDFKWQFIAPLPEEGGVIPRATILAWLEARMTLSMMRALPATLEVG